jgi:anti-sigma regulatory factor (Ser/Thr protein kinase)
LKHALSAHPTAVSRARRYVRERLSDVLPPRKVAEVELLTSELVTNAVRHARLNEGDPIAIEIEAGPTKVRVSVIDAGAGFDFGRMLREPRNATGGWGLFLVEASRTAGGSTTRLRIACGSRSSADGFLGVDLISQKGMGCLGGSWRGCCP